MSFSQWEEFFESMFAWRQKRNVFQRTSIYVANFHNYSCSTEFYLYKRESQLLSDISYLFLTTSLHSKLNRTTTWFSVLFQKCLQSLFNPTCFYVFPLAMEKTGRFILLRYFFLQFSGLQQDALFSQRNSRACMAQRCHLLPRRKIFHLARLINSCSKFIFSFWFQSETSCDTE